MTVPLNTASRLHAIIESSFEGIITIDNAGIIQSFNPAAERMFAYTAEEVIGKNISMLMPSPYQEQHDGYIHSYLTTGDAKIIGKGRELTALRKGGSSLPIWLSVAEFTDNNQHYFTGFIQDLTDVKQAQEASRLYEEEFRLVFENAPTGVAVMNLDGKYVNVNPTLCDILGYSKPELLKLTYIDITHPDDIDVSKDYLRKLLSGDLSGYSLEKRYLRKDNKVINVLLNVALVNENVALAHDEKGEPALLITHILDITKDVETEEQIKTQQEQLAHMDRVSMMGEMAAGIAHEINQPLTAIDSYAKAAQRRIKAENIDYEKLHELLKKISKASLRASDVIARLRAMVKHETKTHAYININTSIEEAANLAQADTQAMEFKIKLELADTLPNVAADAIQIQQVILNLIRNGMEATAVEDQKYKKIIVSSTLLKNENRIQVSVRDFGKGIDEETAQNLFNPFYTTKSSGMGMGLAICQSIIQLHGGHMWFTQNTDKGTTFHFTIPTVLEEA